MAASAYHDNKAYTEGLKMMESKDYSRAACLFTKAIFLFPNQAELYKLRGDAYLAAFDVNSATANYKKAVLLMQQEKVCPTCVLCAIGLALCPSAVVLFRSPLPPIGAKGEYRTRCARGAGTGVVL